MTSAHVRQRDVSLAGIGKPVKGLPIVGQQPFKRIIFGQAYANAVMLFVVFWGCDEIMWITEHESAYAVCAGIDIRRLLRPNNH